MIPVGAILDRLPTGHGLFTKMKIPNHRYEKEEVLVMAYTFEPSLKDNSSLVHLYDAGNTWEVVFWQSWKQAEDI